LDGLIGSPPCPTFSAAGGRAGIAELRFLIEHVHACVTGWRPYVPPTAFDLGGVTPDQRSTLVLEPLRFALECVPTWVALEQVPDVLPVWEAYQYVLRAHGWSVWCGILNAADYGVPQTRRRAILMAHRKREVSPPAPTHCEGGASTMFGELLPWVSMAEALGWGATDRCSPTLHAGKTANGRVYGSAEMDAGRWTFGDQDQSHGCTRTLDQPSPTIPAAADNGNWRFEWAFARPATAVCADSRLSPPGFRGRPEDYDADGTYNGARSMDDALKLSVSDALKLQSFDADYPVQGTKTKCFEQIGNAIPARLARHILASLIGVPYAEPISEAQDSGRDVLRAQADLGGR
jgi:DNA (cytosine-5)-methyltransferase 1